ncbi:hypothetical protein LH464_24075 [Neorhizobium sp. T786]|uniref:hypothetical protein n=1 Tax=Pseudorhizobium xiangyangii TaxID=2883104 RepID=UPI001CFFC4A8|nr:hypothetical protein [Neorhizobium xiangyangii]MCB5205520.1 hypothetical protein [Neorhizobium xiangyangii]
MSPVDIWQSLHAGERRWIAQAAGEPRFIFSDQADGSDRALMQLLAKLDARRWIDLCMSEKER